MIKYTGKLELYCEMGMESPIVLFNVDNMPGLYNWITLQEIKSIKHIVISDEKSIVYEGSISFVKDVDHMYMKHGMFEFFPKEIKGDNWIKYAQKNYQFEFSSKFVIKSLKEIKHVDYRIMWSGNEDHEKDIQLLICKKGYPLYFKENNDIMQSYEPVKSYNKKTGLLTYQDGKQVYLQKVIK